MEFSDWLMYADREATRTYHAQEAAERCECLVCQNFYLNIDNAYPHLRYFLSRFGVDIEAPESLLLLTDELYQASYVVQGRILRYGSEPIWIHDIPVTAEEMERDTFCVHIGLMRIPWTLPEKPEKNPQTSLFEVL